MATPEKPTKAEDSFLAKFEKELNNPANFFVPLLAKIEQLTNVKRIYLAYGFVFLLALYLIIGRAAELVCNAIGFAYPAYQSLKALESRSKDDDTKWLMYWVTFSFFNLAEFFSDAILSWFPPYYLVKLIVLIWLSFPIEKNGSYVLYHTFIRPVFLNNQYKIDEVVSSAVSSVFGMASSTMKEAQKFTKQEKDK